MCVGKCRGADRPHRQEQKWGDVAKITEVPDIGEPRKDEKKIYEEYEGDYENNKDKPGELAATHYCTAVGQHICKFDC